MARFLILAAALCGAGGVFLGSYQAHGLEAFLQRQGLTGEQLALEMDHCAIGVRYQLTHALALLALAALAGLRPHRMWAAAGILFLAGVVLFSGGLYCMVFLGNALHWAIVPSGGLCLILGWLAVGVAAFTVPRTAA